MSAADGLAGTILAGFRPVLLRSPLPQQWLLGQMAWVMALARWAGRGSPPVLEKA